MSATGEGLVDFLELMRLMRARCAWKAGQTHRSLARYLLEESYETVEAIDSGDPVHLAEELGDLLLQVYFHAAIAEENGDFTMDDVVAGLTAKMVRRNPHVFGPQADDGSGEGGARPAQTVAEIEEAWQAAKAAEKSGRTSVLDGLPAALPALLYADKVLGRLGVEPPAPDPGGGSIGDRLLVLVAEARAAGVDPEQELRDAVQRLLPGSH